VRAEQAFQTHRLHVRVHAREGGNIAPVRRQAQACTREHEGGNNRVQKRDAQAYSSAARQSPFCSSWLTMVRCVMKSAMYVEILYSTASRY
jgi:hypothetical protein